MKRIALAASLLLVAAAHRRRRPPRGRARGRRRRRRGDSITVAGNGSVSGRPDDGGALARRRCARSDREAALAANAREMRQVIAAVKAAGGREVGTQSVSLSQVLGAERRADGLRGLERRLRDDRRRSGRAR